MRRIFSLLAASTLVVLLAAAQDGAPDQQNEAKKLFNEGNRLYKAGNYTGAAEKYKAALALDQNFAFHYQLGLCFKNSKQYDDAIASLLASVKLNPGFSGAHNAIGGVYLTQGEFDRAIESFKSALDLDPNLKPAQKGISEAYAGKCQQLFDAGRLEQAGGLADEALAQHSDNGKLYLVAARIYNKQERPDKALDAANDALKLKKGRAKGAEYFEIGIAHKKLQEYDKARSAFAEARKDPIYSRNAQYELDGLKGK
ncbi:MAG: tetratricopeptide repeat protein [Ignavibacteriales bacterium]|nr:tetratricopeptide repeat protein [Ignavibacteriales bacterium]